MLGTKFKSIRQQQGLTQQEFAAKLSTSASYVSEIEKSKKAPGTGILTALKREFGVDLNWLLTDEGDGAAPVIKPVGKVIKKIEQMLGGMDEEAQREVLKYAEEKKLLADLLAGKKKRRKASGE